MPKASTRPLAKSEHSGVGGKPSGFGGSGRWEGRESRFRPRSGRGETAPDDMLDDDVYEGIDGTRWPQAIFADADCDNFACICADEIVDC